MNREIFIKGLSELNIIADENQPEQFSLYSELLKEWNLKMNLTAVTDDDGISVKHFLDSILPISCVDFSDCKKIADVGTGAGFPGIPIKIMLPDISLTLIDSLNKRITFLNEVTARLALDNVECIHARAEELARDKKYRESYDAVLSRAVANMTVLCEYCLPYVKVGGIFVALKAEGSADELNAAKPMMGTLGGRVEDVKQVRLPQSDIMRDIIVVRKEKPTPDKFPRRANKIKAN